MSAEAPARTTTAHFRVESARPAFDRRREAEVTISPRSDGGFLFTVRPFRGHESTLPLEDVAEIVLWKVAKINAKGGR